MRAHGTQSVQDPSLSQNGPKQGNGAALGSGQWTGQDQEDGRIRKHHETQ